jgi:hypothetical protein
MNMYMIVVFAHVVGAMALFGALLMEWSLLRKLFRANTADQARETVDAFDAIWRVRPTALGPVALVVTLLTGIYLAIQWRWEPPWIRVGFASILLLPLFGGTITGRKLGNLKKMLPASGPLASTDLERVRDPLLSLSLRARFGIVLGVVFLMEVKPPLLEGLIAMSVSIAAAIALRGGARHSTEYTAVAKRPDG